MARWIKSSCCGLLAIMWLVSAGASPTRAQTQSTPTPTPAAAATDEFVPLSEAAPREVLPATPMVFYAYAFVWLALIGYVFSIWQRMAKVEEDLAAVQRRLSDNAGRR